MDVIFNPYILCFRYQMAENIDAQLKRMVNDLKEIVEHLNASSGNQDNTDPVSTFTSPFIMLVD